MIEATFPRVLLRDMRFTMADLTLEAQPSLSGEMDATPTMRGHWRAQAQFVLKGEAQTLAWQGFLAQMSGRAGRTLVPAFTRWRPYDADGHGITACGLATIAGSQTFSHFSFARSPVATMTLTAAAPLRATTLKASLGNTTGVRPGQYFSIGDHLYRVRAHWVDSAGLTNITIQPPLRAAATVGAVMVLDQPVCAMRFASDEEGSDWSLLDLLPIVTVNFIEAR